jgi:drug/metabolite transporter (DMT)-like permease
MKKSFIGWSLVLIASLMMSGICMRALALQGVPYYNSLMMRGLVCLGLTMGFARYRKLSLWPKSPGSQALRALLAGLALSLLTLSYNWLTASAVSVLSNMDVPILIVLGPWFGVRAKVMTRALALVSIGLLVFYVSGFELQPDLFRGLSALSAGSLLLCFGYAFIKKSMTEENEAITVLTPSIAILLYGLGLAVFSGMSHGGDWKPLYGVEGLLAGLGMFGAYYSTMRLYEMTDLARAEFPTLLSSVAIQPLEYLFLNVPLRSTYLFSSIGFVAATYIILRRKEAESWL